MQPADFAELESEVDVQDQFWFDEFFWLRQFFRSQSNFQIPATEREQEKPQQKRLHADKN